MYGIDSRTTFTLEYTLTDDTGVVLEERVGADAANCTFGDGTIPTGLEHVLVGHGAGFEAAITLPPEAAFGERRENLVFEAPRENLPDDITLEPGSRLRTGGPNGHFPLRVVGLTPAGAILDGNHPLAGRTLCYRLRVIAVRPAAPCASATRRRR
ncbi:MAG: FKBP-type peptidyl-prolyl cis-trans isomerase [Halofilum sp. (in: g-proteobacteria)]|nr:FKBP-type peptidyl-prolyl cis-trans isomerase [Halofilum sp. (in: g-proteobacteria)]